MDYERAPDAIYAQSFATIRREARLEAVPIALHEIVVRMIHACGMVDLVGDFVGIAETVTATQTALKNGAPIFCDCEMVRAGITAKALPNNNERVVTLNDPRVRQLATDMGTTRSAAAVELWRDRLEGAIVVIGNAPTALFYLLEMLERGGPKPAAIIATPVGFVGAAESKQALIDSQIDVPYVTITGRRGGSAIASSAFNAIGLGCAI